MNKLFEYSFIKTSRFQVSFASLANIEIEYQPRRYKIHHKSISFS